MNTVSRLGSLIEMLRKPKLWAAFTICGNKTSVPWEKTRMPSLMASTEATLGSLSSVCTNSAHGDSFAAQSFDRLPHGDSALRVEPRAGLVEEENRGTMGNGACDLYPLLQAAGEL